MSLEQDIRAEIENIKKLKMEVGNINNHLSALEGMCRERNQKASDEAYHRGINDGSLDVKQRVEGAYRKGLDDAWEAARKIVVDPDHGGIASETLLEIFGMRGYSYIMQENTAQQAIDKIKAYEDNDRIKVGDEVVWNDGTTLTVTRVHKLDDDEWCDGMDEDGRMYGVLKNNVRKTGRHYDVQSILEAMQDVTER